MPQNSKSDSLLGALDEYGRNGRVLTRLTAAGVLDTHFGTQGFFSVEPLFFASSTRFIQQPDGGLLIVSDVWDATQEQHFALQLTRLNPAGVRDLTYAPNGEKILSEKILIGLPPSSFRIVSVIAEPNGGFTVMARDLSSGVNTSLLVRVTAAGTLNLGFGNGGWVSGYDFGNPFNQPVAMVRAANGGLLLMGDASPYPNGKIVLWRVTAGGLADTSFGTAGRLEIGNSNSDGFRLVALSDGSIALVDSVYVNVNGVYVTTAHVTHFDASGVVDSAFGTAGSATIALAGYRAFSAISVLPNSTGGLLIPAMAYRTEPCENSFDPPACIPRGMDTAVASLDGSGHLQTSYGRGDGFAVVNTAEYYSNDKVDAILVETSGKVVLAGSSDADGILDYLLERLTENGSPDIAFGTNGRVAPRQNNRFMSKVRAAKQENGAITVVSERTIATALRFDSTGTLYTGFAPALAVPATFQTDIALGIRPDGRMLYVRITNTAPISGQIGTAYLQQTMPDGTPDLDFGILSAGEPPFHTDLVLLDDGSAVYAVQTDRSLRLYKIDSHGLAVTSFGTDSQFTMLLPNHSQLKDHSPCSH